MNSNVLRIVVSVLLLACCVNASAHHSHASLNTDDIRRFEGVVTKYSWRAPHVYIQANVMGEDGEVREYKVEALNPPAMTALGWKKDSFEPGDRIIWEGAHDKDVNRPYAGINWAELEDGTRLHANPTDYRKAQAALAAALAEQVVEPVAAIGTGSWTRIADDGSRHPAIRTPATDWPLTAAAAEAVANWSEHDNPLNNCVYGGPPRSIVSLSNFMWSRPDESTIIIDRDMWFEARVVHLNTDAAKGERSGFGHSVGHFEGEELIVETDNFIAETWGMYTGIDSTEQKSLYERYWLSEGGLRLNVEFTVTDPGVLTTPYTYTHQWKRVPDRELNKAPCSLENARAYKVAEADDVAAMPAGPVDAPIDEDEQNFPWLYVLLAGVVVVLLAGFLRRKK